MIVEAVLMEVFSPHEDPGIGLTVEFELPGNLKRFFAGRKTTGNVQCCGAASEPSGAAR